MSKVLGSLTFKTREMGLFEMRQIFRKVDRLKDVPYPIVECMANLIWDEIKNTDIPRELSRCNVYESDLDWAIEKTKFELEKLLNEQH